MQGEVDVYSHSTLPIDTDRQDHDSFTYFGLRLNEATPQAATKEDTLLKRITAPQPSVATAKSSNYSSKRSWLPSWFPMRSLTDEEYEEQLKQRIAQMDAILDRCEPATEEESQQNSDQESTKL